MLEEKVFGGYLPKVESKVRPPRFGLSERKGPGGRNAISHRDVPDSSKMEVVEYLLKTKRPNPDIPKPVINWGDRGGSKKFC